MAAKGASPAAERELAQRLVAGGKLSPEDLERCLAAQRALGGPERAPLARILVERGLATPLQIEETHAIDGVPPAPRDVSSLLRSIGRYEVVRELGRGGMGVVYSATDPALKRSVALKMLLDPGLARPDEVARFRREAQAVARLRHPGIVQVFEIGEHAGLPFIAMELVEGESFEALLRRGPAPPRRVAAIVRGVALALAHAHEQGIVHRDVKPANVLLDREGAPRLTDFGLARSAGTGMKLTATGEVLGTPVYMAPEQARGIPGEQGPHTDVYALGAVLYRAIAGRPPFEGGNVQALLMKIMTEEPAPPRSLDEKIHPDLETIAQKCLAKEPRERYASAGHVAEELRRFLDGEAILARPEGAVGRRWRWVRRNPGLSAAFGALFLVLATASPAVYFTNRARERAEVERRKADEARKRAEEAEEKAEARRKVAQALSDALGAALHSESPGTVLKSLDRAIELDPTIELAWLVRGLFRKRAGNLDGAIADLNHALELDPNDSRAYLHRAEARAPRDFDAAIADFTRSFELHPTGYILIERGRMRRLKGDLDGALADFTRALELLPGDQARGEIQQLQAGIFWGDAQAEAALTRGWAFELQGRVKEALAEYDLAVERSPRLQRALGARAVLRRKLGDREGAKKDFSRFLELDPSPSDAATARQALAELEAGK